MFTLSEENYLKAIYHLGLNSEIGVSTNEIAKKMQTKASSVTDMIKKLSDKDLVVYEKYKGVKITDFGRNTAANIVRKHRLWEVFLVEKLNFSWDEVHEVAEQLEHIKSPKLINELDALLGFPKQDPHGDPIPDKEGNYHPLEKKLLATLSIGEKGICIGVNDSSSEFLQFLDKQKIALGNQIKVLGKEPFDDSIQIQIANRELSVSNKIASNLYIKIHHGS
jgi:DtxR family Mn-dependent transcriptional regulator|tara:strand:+ start:94 stop:759 length:666 start_codon:yes stop_codon:yes gene_type:complete